MASATFWANICPGHFPKIDGTTVKEPTLEKTLLRYLDDVIVIAPDFDTHTTRLAEVFSRLKHAGLKLKPGKCELLKEKVRYVRHIVSAEGIATQLK